jgi:hypothetical protein
MDQALQLKDIHLPEAVGCWPPAIGWWLLPILLLLLAALFWWLYKKVTEKSALKSAKKLLEQIKAEQGGDLQKLQQLSSWLRRVSMSVSGREMVAGLTGDKWLQKLDESVEGCPFSKGIGRCLGDAHYRKKLPDDCDVLALTELCEQWLKGQKR